MLGSITVAQHDSLTYRTMNYAYFECVQDCMLFQLFITVALTRTICKHVTVVKLVEHLTCNQDIAGSSPCQIVQRNLCLL